MFRLCLALLFVIAPFSLAVEKADARGFSRQTLRIVESRSFFRAPVQRQTVILRQSGGGCHAPVGNDVLLLRSW